MPAAVLVSFLLMACREAPSSSPAPAASVSSATSETKSAADETSALTRVTDTSFVCMVNDRFMGSEQIPVAVDGKTYYGCCASCKDKLQNNVEARTAVDPVTQQPVDKATAVIGKTAKGAVMYFENEASFNRYAKK